MRTLVDANVVLRYLLHDDETLHSEAERAIKAGAFLLPEVLAEVVYVLLGVYSVPRDELSLQLRRFIDEIQCDHPEVLRTALELFGASKLDFVDCLLAAYNSQLGDVVVSFDRKLNKTLRR